MEFTFYGPLLWLLAIIALVAGYRLTLVDRPARWKRASFLLRVVGVILLVLSMCRPVVRIENKDVHVIFLVDVSESMDLEAVRARLADVEAGIDALGTGDSHDLFAFADGVRRFASPGKLTDVLAQWSDGIADDQFRSGSRLGEAMLSTRLSFPAEKARRIAVFSDGKETHRGLDEVVALLRKEAIDVVFAETAGFSRPEASVVSIQPTTPHAFEGEIVRMRVTLTANQPIDGTLRILHRGVAVAEKNVSLTPDEETLEEIDVEMTTSGDSLWVAELVPQKDHFPLNNQAKATVRVSGKPRILALHQKPLEMRSFTRALREQGVELETRSLNGLPTSMEGILAYDAVLLADIPATSLSVRQMQLLKRYVTDFGGGLAMFGSENSFGLGGYYKTPVEEVLPLISRFEKEKEKPSLAMMLIIDKSGSMSGAPIALARQAAKAAVELLSVRDQVGVIGFDSNPQIITEMRSAAEKGAIMSLIDTLDASGGTNLYPAMLAGKDMLDNTAAKIKHMIILSDGQTGGADFQGLTQSLVDTGVTISTVALGSGAARQLMASIAEIGRGRYYETMDPATVPQIFTKETMQASKSAIKEDIYGVVQVDDHPILSGYQGVELPFVLGFVMTEPKPTAQVLLAAETGDPLLAISRFGLGNGLAYASDMTERWGGEWFASDDAGKFWAQAFRAIIGKEDAQGFMVTERVANDVWKLEIRRSAEDRTPVNGIEWDARALDENGKELDVNVTASGLGRYEAEIPLLGHERLTLRLLDKGHDKLEVLHFNRAYPKEYALKSDIPQAVQAMQPFTPETLREGTIPVVSHRSVAHWFSLAGLLCLFAGIVCRRI